MDRDARVRRVVFRTATSARPPLTPAGLARALWLVSPLFAAGVAHALIIVFDPAPWLARPIDGGFELKGKPIFGRNKTWRGFVVMPAAAAITVSAQVAAAQRWPERLGSARLRAGAPPAPIVGALCGLAYVLAELPNSFAKRRLGIAPGAQGATGGRLQYVVDQMDSVIGCTAAVNAFYEVTSAEAVGASLLGGALHIIVERVMRALPRHRASS